MAARRDASAIVAESKFGCDPFKQISTADLRRLCKELGPAELKVWLYTLSRSGPENSSFASLQTICTDTDQSLKTVKKARKWLRENGWLVDKGHLKSGRGRKPVPVLKCVFAGQAQPTRCEHDDAGQNLPPVQGQNLPPEVDSKPEVYGAGRSSSLHIDFGERKRVGEHAILIDDEKLKSFLLEEFKTDPRFPALNSEHISFAIQTIRERAPEPPVSLKYWLISVEKFLVDYPAELRAEGHRQSLAAVAYVGVGPTVNYP